MVRDQLRLIQGGLVQGGLLSDAHATTEMDFSADNFVCIKMNEATVNQPVQRVLQLNLINARSVVNKLPELHSLIYGSADTDCFCFTETWLTESVADGMLDPESMFTVFRSDRQRARGGGVCLLINKHIKAVQVQLQNSPSDVDMLCIDLLFCQPYRMFVVYSPPSVSSELVTMSSLVRCLEDNCNRLGPTLIVGDFNCPQIDWSKMLAPAENGNKKLLDFVVQNGFNQIVTQPTRSSNILDVIMINDPFLFINAEVIEPFGTSDHNVVKAAFIYDTPVQSSYLCNKSATKTYFWKLGDYVSMSQYLRAYNWDYLFSTNLTVDSM